MRLMHFYTDTISAKLTHIKRKLCVVNFSNLGILQQLTVLDIGSHSSFSIMTTIGTCARARRTNVLFR